MSVEIRKKELKSGKYSLYLDIYHNGTRSYEFLQIYMFKRARTPIDTIHNKEAMSMAQSIRSKREAELTANDYDIPTQSRKKVSIVLYYEKFLNEYINKDKRIVRYSFERFKEYLVASGIGIKITPKDITVQLCVGYKSFLEEKLNGETPYNYFTKFKKMLKQAVKDKLITSNPCEEIINKRNEGLKKDILTFEEIQLLYNAKCGNKEVKRAFLFTLNTGLRWCDIINMKCRQVDSYSKKVKVLQLKTKEDVTIDLNLSAITLLGQRGGMEESVFKLPSHTGCLKSLKNWKEAAGIEKNITWHCGRHSFAVNLLYFNNDIKTVSSLLGHKRLRHTEKYTRAVSELKEKAVNSLPALKFD